MPEELEKKLKKEVQGKPWSDERKAAYIYGTINKQKQAWKTKKKVFKT